MTKKLSLSTVELDNVPFKEKRCWLSRLSPGTVGIELFQYFNGLEYIFLVIRLDLGPFAESTA